MIPSDSIVNDPLSKEEDVLITLLLVYEVELFNVLTETNGHLI